MKKLFENLNSHDEEFLPEVDKALREFLYVMILFGSIIGMGVLSCLI